MIKKIFCCIFQGICTLALAQNVWKVASPSYSTTSNPQLAILSVERTAQFTIIEMAYSTGKKDSVYLEICNTFHLRSGGQKVARFVKAEGAPIEDMTNKLFECEAKAVGRFVPSETRAYFKVYFEALPPQLKTIDLIEYDGKEACEFDVLNIQLLFENPSLPAPPPSVVKPPGETRPITVANETTVHQEFVELEIWDNDVEDGDVLSLSLNQNWILQGYELSKSKKKLRIQLKRGENWLVMKAENLGSIPPNTAAIAIQDGENRKVFILNSDKGFSEALKIKRL